MKLRKIEIENINYDSYRRWLEELAHAKALLIDRENKRAQVGNTIRKQREVLSTLYKEENRIQEEIRIIRENLIDVLPSKL